MEDTKYLNQLNDIRSIMDRSTKFLSLSGLSGVLAGIYAICGALAVNYIIETNERRYITLESNRFKAIIGIAALVLILSLITAFILSRRKASKTGESLLNSSAKRMAINFCVPLFAGGIFSISLIFQGHYGLIGAITLLFYGLAVFNASKYSLDTLRSLGISFIILGLVALNFRGYSLYFWTFGFGFLHILYGSIMYFKYDRIKE